MIIHKKLIKSHKPHVNSIEYKTTILLQGNIGLKVLEKGWIEVKQYNAMKHYLKRFLKKKRGCI
jgi:ribosomal protein L16/L10AE